MATRDTTDVLIIGAGPTGLTLANLLGGMGVKTTIVERNSTTVQEPRAVSIDDESMRAMQAAGLSQEVEAITSRGYGSLYKGPKGDVFTIVKPTGREYGFDKRNAFQQPELETILRDGLKRFSSVTAYFACEMTSFTNFEDRVHATLTHGDGTMREISATYMIACDGGRSQIRKTLKINMNGSTFEEPWLIVDLASTENRGFHTEVFCDPRRPCISLPGPDGIRRYEFMLHRDEDKDAAVEETSVRKLLARFGPDQGAPLRRVQVYTFHARLADRWRVGRVFLAGDAAHLTPPFAGQGMNSGLRDAHNLAWKLSEALKSAFPDEILDSYEIERKPHAWSMIQLAERMGRVMMPASPVQGFLTRCAFRLLGLYPPLRDYFGQMKYKPKPRFVRGLISADARPAARTVVGRMFPQPVVETVDRQRVLLDNLLPDDPVLVIFDASPDAIIDEEIVAKFEALGIFVLGLTPEWSKPQKASFVTVRDASMLLSSKPYSGYLGHALLLRRDRYVAATAEVSKASELLATAKKIAPGRSKGS